MVVGEMLKNLAQVDLDSPGRLKPGLAERSTCVGGRAICGPSLGVSPMAAGTAPTD
jgi:hypothetical protein